MSSRTQFNEYFSLGLLEKLASRYEDYATNAISVGSVKDFCDSADHLGPLAQYQLDLKDMQRCWMLKAIMSTFARGAKLVEIGAGEPIVAGLLTRLGYKVTVIDPYDGNGNGPLEFETFQRDYSDIEFRREYLSNDTDFGVDVFDGFYSISVLEHVPLEKLSALAAGIRKGSHSNTKVVHAVDHVIRGHGSEYHGQMLLRVANMCGLPASALWDVLATAEEDVDTYFLSAEAHNRWRSGQPYEQFPMRRCVSVQFKGSPQ